MKQIVQELKKGITILEDVAIPQVKAGTVLVSTTHSLVSQGTERMLVDFGKASYLDKARQQPDRVKEVLAKIKTDGLSPTVAAVQNKLNQPIALGYSNVGKIVEVGVGVTSFQVGDRIISNGFHAEYVVVPENLCAIIPENVTDESASFTVVGAIALQGIRLANPTFGETVVVFGLGLIGLITAQLLKANGCRVIGIDVDDKKCELSKHDHIETINPSNQNVVESVRSFTAGVGADAVIITASAKDDKIVHQAADMSRKRGRIILVGVVNLDLRRDDFYKKELSFQVSCSYGPGRYDDHYEQQGLDYPLPYVRWTEKRNFEAVLSAISKGQLDVAPYISEIVDLENYGQIYDNMHRPGIIASIFKYPEDGPEIISRKVNIVETPIEKSSGTMGIIGAGNFTSSTILPALTKAKASIKYICSSGGLSATTLAKKANIPYAVSDTIEILSDSAVTGVLVTTRHNLHAALTVDSLNAGKHVFVEKPLCLTSDELENIIDAVNTSGKTVVVGFNRRFSSHAIQVKKYLDNRPINIIATMNAGYIPPDVWVHDMHTGGGRIVGEACHFIDLCSYFTESEITSVCMNSMGANPQENTDNASILIKYANGSNAVINYFSNGSKSYPKERIELFGQGRVFIIDNWRITKGYGVKGFKTFKTKMDKGHQHQFNLLKESWETGGSPLISFSTIVNTTKATLAVLQSLKTRSWIQI